MNLKIDIALTGKVGPVQAKNAWGIGAMWGDSWVGYLMLEMPFDPKTMAASPEPAIELPFGDLVNIQVSKQMTFQIAAGPYCPGGYRHSQGNIVTLYWRCALPKGSYIIK